MTNLDAFIMTNNDIGGTIHQFAKALNVKALELASVDLEALFHAMPVNESRSFVSKAAMNQKGLTINGKPFIFKSDILAEV